MHGCTHCDTKDQLGAIQIAVIMDHIMKLTLWGLVSYQYAHCRSVPMTIHSSCNLQSKNALKRMVDANMYLHTDLFCHLVANVISTVCGTRLYSIIILIVVIRLIKIGYSFDLFNTQSEKAKTKRERERERVCLVI